MAKMIFPKQIERQFKEPLEVDRLVDTLADLEVLKDKATVYPTMLVGCKENGYIYAFNEFSGKFDPIVSSMINDAQASDTTTYSSNKIENDFAKKAELHSHDNKDVLDSISSSGDMLLFNGKTTVIPTSKPSTVVAGSIWIETV